MCGESLPPPPPLCAAVGPVVPASAITRTSAAVAPKTLIGCSPWILKGYTTRPVAPPSDYTCLDPIPPAGFRRLPPCVPDGAAFAAAVEQKNETPTRPM